MTTEVEAIATLNRVADALERHTEAMIALLGAITVVDEEQQPSPAKQEVDQHLTID